METYVSHGPAFNCCEGGSHVMSDSTPMYTRDSCTKVRTTSLHDLSTCIVGSSPPFLVNLYVFQIIHPLFLNLSLNACCCLGAILRLSYHLPNLANTSRCRSLLPFFVFWYPLLDFHITCALRWFYLLPFTLHPQVLLGEYMSHLLNQTLIHSLT